MSFALSSGVTGLQAHQQMLDVAGNNLANVNTTAFKSSRILFSELLSQTIRKASQPTVNTGGTNPVQMGSDLLRPLGVQHILRLEPPAPRGYYAEPDVRHMVDVV